MRRIFLILSITLVLAGCGNSRPVSLGDQNSQLLAEDAWAEVDNEVVLQAKPYDKDLYDALFNQASDVGDIGEIRGAIVPHHIVGGNIPATLFNYLKKQNPSVLVIFGPNHFQSKGSHVISAINSWETPYGKVKTDKKILDKLYENNVASDDVSVMTDEHSIGALVSFAAHYLPDTKIVPLIIPYYAPLSSADSVLQTLLPELPDDVVFISSIDFSHYQNPAVAAYHDEFNRNVVGNFDYERLNMMEMDSPTSLYALWRSMEKFNSQKIAYEMTGSSDIRMNNPALEETTSYYSPFFVDGKMQADKTTSILFFGDMMLDRNVKKQIDTNGTDYLFSKLAGQENRFFMGMDLIHTNLEGPFADSRRQTTKEIAFRFDPILLPMLKKYNFGMFSQANNHTLDMSSAGFEESKKNLAAAGFDVYGSQYRVDNGSLLVKKVGDYNIAFIGLNDTNSPISLDATKKLIQEGREQAAFVVVNIHWGQEYKEVSNARQRDLAHIMIDAGADIIIGHHPHVVQEMEIYNNRPIFYSLGNFVFDQYFSVPTQQSLGVGMILRDGAITAYVFPLEQNKSQVSQMPYIERTKYLSDWVAKSRLGSYTFSNNKLIVNSSP